MAAECIHGFEEGLCDTCWPAKVPEVVKPIRASGTRATKVVRHSGKSATAVVTPMINLATQRIYHVTHERNLPGILADQRLRADATPAVDVSSSITREMRETADLASGRTVAQHVPFFLSPNAGRWEELRTGALGAHWSDEARAASPLDYVILVSTAEAIGPDVVLSDRDAAEHDTRVAIGLDAVAPAIRRVHSSDPDFHEPEVLAPDEFDFAHVSLIGVANEKVRDRVKAALKSAGGHAPKVSVYPPWFQASE